MIQYNNKKIDNIWINSKFLSKMYCWPYLIWTKKKKSEDEFVDKMPNLSDYQPKYNLSGRFTQDSTLNDYYLNGVETPLVVDEETKVFDQSSEIIADTNYSNNWFKDNSKLYKIYSLPVSNSAQYFSGVFQNCTSMVYCKIVSANKRRDGADFTTLQSVDNLFYNCEKLEQIYFDSIGFSESLKYGGRNMFQKCKSLYYIDFNFTQPSTPSFSTSVYFGDSPLLRGAALNVIRSLAKVIKGSQTITFNRWTFEQLKDDEKQMAEDKGWNIEYSNVNDIILPPFTVEDNEDNDAQKGYLSGKVLPSFSKGSVVLYDTVNKKYIPIDIDNKDNVYDLSKYPVVGVVCIGQEENAYSDGSAGIMAIKANSYVTPNKGFININNDESPCWGLAEIVGTLYNIESTARTVFNQKVQNSLLCSFAPYEWKNSSSIVNIPSTNTYPAAWCSWRYFTPGTTQGQWYLPSSGELNLLLGNLNIIKTTFFELSSQGVECFPLSSMGKYDMLYSCTEQSYGSVYAINVNDNKFTVANKNIAYYSIPFTTVK